MRIVIGVLLLMATSCGDSQVRLDARLIDGQSADVDASFARDCGNASCVNVNNPEDHACLGACTSCAWGIDGPEPAGATDGDSCTISDWEHEFACTFVEPDGSWLCCGASATAGVLCQYGSCGTARGEPCCPGMVDDAFVCVEGRWAEPNGS